MPYLHIHTNIEIADKADLLRVASAETASLLGKPESYVMVELSDTRPMLFGGSDAPLAFVELKSLGLSQSQTKTLSGHLCALIGRELSIDASRIYIEFAAPERAMFGWNGGTF
ncbi:MAG: phenylpyruvate tautomerase MIF-related protein [Mariprofundus sp.]